MVDNFDKIAAYLETKTITDDMFFHIRVMIRHKDVEWFPHGKNDNARTIYSVNITSVEELYDQKRLISTMCDALSARAYINLVPKTYTSAASIALENATRSYITKNYIGLQSSWSKGVAHANIKSESLYLVDIDKEDLDKTDEVCNFINTIRPEGNKLVLTINSKTGLHLICKKFDTNLFNETYPSIDVKKEANTILYC